MCVSEWLKDTKRIKISARVFIIELVGSDREFRSKGAMTRRIKRMRKGAEDSTKLTDYGSRGSGEAA